MNHAPASVDILESQLQRAARAGDLAGAERCAQAIVDAQPSHEQAWSFLVTLAMRRQQAARARELATRAVQARADSSLLHLHLGVACEALGDFDAARVALEDSLRRDPQQWFAAFWLVSVLDRLGLPEASLSLAVRTLSAAEREGFLLHLGQAPAAAQSRVQAAIAKVNLARAGCADAALAPHGDHARRVRIAMERLNGQRRYESDDPLQRPSFLLLPGLPAQAWFERDQFPFLAALEAEAAAICAELLQVLADEDGLLPYVDMPDNAPAAPAWRELNRSPRWSAYHLFRHGERVAAHAERCPRTCAALEQLPLVRIPGHGPEAMFSILRPGTAIPPHTGVINGRLTCHLPLVVPENCGGLRVGRETREWSEGRCLVFDDTLEHEAWNHSAHTRVVLIFDLWDPRLAEGEREAYAAAITAIGDFHRRYGGGDRMQESA